MWFTLHVVYSSSDSYYPIKIVQLGIMSRKLVCTTSDIIKIEPWQKLWFTLILKWDIVVYFLDFLFLRIYIDIWRLNYFLSIKKYFLGCFTFVIIVESKFMWNIVVYQVLRCLKNSSSFEKAKWNQIGIVDYC